MFRAGFHTGYVPSGVLRLTKAQLDGSNADPRYDDDFFIDLIFAPVMVSNSDGGESGHVTGAGAALYCCVTVCVIAVRPSVCLSNRIGQRLRHPHRRRLHRQIRSEPTQRRAVLGIHRHSEDEGEETKVPEVRLCPAGAVQYLGRRGSEWKRIRQPQYKRNKLSFDSSGDSTTATAAER